MFLSFLNACSGLQDIVGWLLRNGLKCDPDKMEFISFYPHKSQDLVGGRVTALRFLLPSGPLEVKRSELIRYLGVFIHHKFDWSHHVTIMANRARSTSRALTILGNSVRGLDYANWHKIFHALILPVLTYGFPLFSTSPRIKGLIKTLQVAQNVIVWKMSGCVTFLGLRRVHFSFSTCLLSLSHHVTNHPSISIT